MANVQTEHGYTRIANDLLHALVIYDLSAAEIAICLSIIRKTYGFHQTKTKIAYSILAQMTGFHRVTVINTVSQLIKKRVLGREKAKTRTGVNKMWINKDYAQWSSSLRITKTSSLQTTKTSSPETTHIKKLNKLKEINEFKNIFMGRTTMSTYE